MVSEQHKSSHAEAEAKTPYTQCSFSEQAVSVALLPYTLSFRASLSLFPYAWMRMCFLARDEILGRGFRKH